jgi:uncharacterized membrane protein YqjE
MNGSQNKFNSRRSTGSVMSDLVHGFQGLVRSEIRLAKTEFQLMAKDTTRHIRLAIVFGVIALLGTLPFLSFLVIGLGRLLNDNYWLSSLILSIVCIGVGSLLGVRFIHRVTNQDFSFPHTRQSVQGETEVVREKIQEVTETFQRKAS